MSGLKYQQPTYSGTIKFIPIKHGDEVDLGATGVLGVSGDHKYLGFKPGRAGKREGWLVVLVKNGKKAPKKVRKS